MGILRERKKGKRKRAKLIGKIAILEVRGDSEEENKGAEFRELRSEVAGDAEVGGAPARLRIRAYFFSSRSFQRSLWGFFD